MLPTKVTQYDYQDVANIVWNSLDDILNYQKENNVEFIGVISKIRNGMIAGSIISNELCLSLGSYSRPRDYTNIEKEVFIPKEILQKYDEQENPHILFVDSVGVTGSTTIEAKEFIKSKYPKLKIITYVAISSLIASKDIDISGLIIDSFIQPPWEWKSYTTQTHLDRLLSGNTKSSTEKDYSLGYSCQRCKDQFLLSLNFDFTPKWEIVFDLLDIQRNLPSASGVGNLEAPEYLTFEEARGKYKQLIEEKKKFIFTNGLTHYIEDDWVQAILLSSLCPATHILYFDGKELNKIYSKHVNKEKFIELYY